MLRRNNGSVGMVGFRDERGHLDRILAIPTGWFERRRCVAIEGPTRARQSASARAGSFPRVIASTCGERKALTLEQAIRKMTALPASRLFHLTDRGAGVGLAATSWSSTPAQITRHRHHDSRSVIPPVFAR